MKISTVTQDISIIRDCSAGSNATTILCMDEKSTFYRKYAYGADGDKLFQQIEWIENNKNKLPLPIILKYEKNEEICFYDMAYSNYSIGMFEYVHSMPVSQSWLVLNNVLDKLENSIYRCDIKKDNRDVIHSYYDSKIKKNIEYILNCECISGLHEYETLKINGVEYKNLSHYLSLLSENNLLDIFENDECSVIHGDLTLENIICTRSNSGEEGFYFIDPNTGNIHDSKYLDYAKILQSLHGEYEFIKSAEEISANHNKIDFTYTKSIIYRDLYNLYLTYLKNKFDENAIKSIYFHEIVHWLRLMPYQIKNNKEKAVAFYARMIILLNELEAKYGDGK